ncbi:MAG: YraN family protein [Bacteroidales bacterium]|nr:YraN family protein [Bacteroidales bacterium]
MKREETTVEKGRRAEDIAAGWLEAHGLRILERNYRHNHLEIDIIAEGPLLTSEGKAAEPLQNSSFIHIVEVRSRAEGSIVAPELTILPHKQKLLANAADAFVRSSKCHKEVVFDVIGIEMSEQGHTLTFTPEAFRPHW